MIFEFFPNIYSDVAASGISQQVGDYGVLTSLDVILQDKVEKANSEQIENETKVRLDKMKLVEYDPDNVELEYQVKQVESVGSTDFEPTIFRRLDENPSRNNTSILQWLLDQPLNYWIFTKSNDQETWTKAALRRTLLFPEMNLDKWWYVNADNNISNGNELRVRFDIVIKEWNFNRPTFRPPPPTPGNIEVKGGFGLTVERLVNRTFPIELNIAKSVSYENENYIWITGIEFDETPPTYESEILAETIEFGELSDKLITLLGSALGSGNISNVILTELNGPYSLRFKFDQDITKYNLMAGMVKFENLTLTDKNWLVFYLTPAKGMNFITRSGEVWVDSSDIQAPIDQLKWTAGIYDSSEYKIPINLKVRYGEERRHFIFANIDLITLPKWFDLKIDYTKVKGGQNITVLHYEADSVLDALDYTSYVYPDYFAIPQSLQMNSTHVRLEGIPSKFHMEMTSDIGRDINSTPYIDPQAGIAANLINNLIVRMAYRFYRIGKYLKLAAEGLLELPDKKGWATLDTYGTSFSTIEFYQSTGEYLDAPGNFMAFFNTSYSNTSTNESTKLVNQNSIAISGRLHNLYSANFSFGAPLEFEVRAMADEEFNGLFIEGENYAKAHISNVPGYLKIENDGKNSYYSTLDPSPEYGGAGESKGTIIEKFQFISQIDKHLMELEINGVPGSLEFKRKPDLITFSTQKESSIEEFNFRITSDRTKPLYELNSGDFISVVQDKNYVMGSGKFSGIKNLTYDSTDEGYFELNLDSEKPFHVLLINHSDRPTKAKLIVDPLPKKFLLELPGIVKETKINFPDISNLTNLIDYSEIVFTLGKLGNDVIDLLGNMTESLIDSIGNIGYNFSISYELESFGTSMDMIAEIERDGIALDETVKKIVKDQYATKTDKVLNPVGWTHGITMQQDEYDGIEVLRGHLYLQGMPKKASISTQFTQNRTIVEFDFSEYDPEYKWLLIDLKGIQKRDVNVFFQKIPEYVDFHASADLITNLEIGGEMRGVVDIKITDSGEETCSQKLGALYVSMHTYEPIQSIREFAISELPADLYIDFQIQKEMFVKYDASCELEFVYSKLSKMLSDSWHHMNLILHDLPEKFEFNFKGNTDFDIEDALPLQGLPRLEMNTFGTNTLDLKLSLDSAAVGQRGNVDLFLQDIQDTTGKLKGNSYRIDSIGLGYFRLKMTDLPILDNYRLNSMILEAEDLKSLVFKVNLLFGVYPYFDLGSNTDGKIEITIDHTIKIFGQDLHAKVALIDIVYEDVSGARIPVATPVFVNSINSNLKKSQNHVIIPAVITSLVISWIDNL